MSVKEEKLYQFEKLEIWELSLEIIEEVYRLTRGFPREEKFSLANQIQRAAVSIALNIAEGKGASSDKELARFLNISLRSLFEVVGGFKIAIRLKFTNDNDCEFLFNLCSKEGAKIKQFIKKLENE